MPPEPTQSGSRPLTSFLPGGSAPASAPLARPAAVRPPTKPTGSSTRDKSKQRAADDSRVTGADETVSGAGQAAQTGPSQGMTAAAWAFKPLRSFAPGPPTSSSPAHLPRRAPAKANAPAAPARTTATPAVQPATKRSKRVLATEEEVQQWETESRRAEKGKGRETVEGARPARGAEAARADKAKVRPPAALPQSFRPLSAFALPSPAARADGSRPSASVSTTAAHAASRPRVTEPAKLPHPPPPAHRLSSLLASPAAVAARPASPASASGARFTQLLPPRSGAPATPARETKGILARAPPVQAAPAADSDGEEEGRDEWSPRKKKGGYLLAGLAARASAALAAARTAQTLWLHDVSRALSAAEGARTREELARELGPAVRVLVLEVLAWQRAAGEPAAGGRDRRRERRTVLTRCRLLLPLTAGPPTDAEDDPPAAERDTTGLVLFSLHERPSSSSSSAVPAPSPTKRTGPTSPAGLFIPTTAHDLRFVRPGAELWAWEPVREVILSARAEDWRVAPPAPPAREVEEEDEEVRVGWALGAEEERERRERAQRERDGDRVTRALVCGRFAVVI